MLLSSGNKKLLWFQMQFNFYIQTRLVYSLEKRKYLSTIFIKFVSPFDYHEYFEDVLFTNQQLEFPRIWWCLQFGDCKQEEIYSQPITIRIFMEKPSGIESSQKLPNLKVTHIFLIKQTPSYLLPHC